MPGHSPTIPAVTHYEVLGVAPTATPVAIRRAYLARARRHHPDFYASAEPGTRARAEREMQRLNEAWAVLGDPRRRHAYDAELRREARSTHRPGAPSPGFRPVRDDDTDYAALLDDAPAGDGVQVPKLLQILPVVLLAVGIFSFSAGMVTSLAPLLALGVLAIVGSGVSFVLAPMLAVLRGHRGDLDA